jgi:hypothetical protein
VSTRPTTSTTTPPEKPGFLGVLVVRALVSGACPAWLAARLLRAVVATRSWNAHYEALRRVERALSSTSQSTSTRGASALAPGQVDLVESLILASVAPSPTPRLARARRFFASPLVVFPAGAAAGVVAMLVVRAPAPSEHKWTERGRGDAPHVGVRARCVDASAHRVVGQAEAGPRMVDDRLTCPRGDLLSVSLTNLETDPYYVFVVGVGANGALRFISPFDESSTAREATPGAVDQPLDVLADTASLPADGDVTLFTLFSKTPLSGAEVARRMRDARARGVAVHALAQLPFDAYTARIELATP